MISIIAIVVAVCGLAIVTARLTDAPRLLRVAGYSGLFLLVTQLVWAMLMFRGVVRLDSIFRSFGRYDAVEWYRTVALTPPVVATVVFATVLWRRWS